MSLSSHFPLVCKISVELTEMIRRLEEAEAATPPAGGGARPRLDRGRDLTRVSWPGLAGSFWLTPPQARAVSELVDALLACRSHEVDQEVLLRAARVPGARRLADVFRDSRAWGTLVIPGEATGSYRLPRLPEPPDDAA